MLETGATGAGARPFLKKGTGDRRKAPRPCFPPSRPHFPAHISYVRDFKEVPHQFELSRRFL